MYAHYAGMLVTGTTFSFAKLSTDGILKIVRFSVEIKRYLGMIVLF